MRYRAWRLVHSYMSVMMTNSKAAFTTWTVLDRVARQARDPFAPLVR